MGRLDRIGQEFPMDFYFMVAEGTIEEDILRIVQEKQSILDQVLDGAPEDSSTLNVFDEFIRILIKKGKKR